MPWYLIDESFSNHLHLSFIGYTLSDPHSFSSRFFKIFNGAMGIPKDAKVEEIEVEIDDEEEVAAEPGKLSLKELFILVCYIVSTIIFT